MATGLWAVARHEAALGREPWQHDQHVTGSSHRGALWSLPLALQMLLSGRRIAGSADVRAWQVASDTVQSHQGNSPRCETPYRCRCWLLMRRSRRGAPAGPITALSPWQREQVTCRSQKASSHSHFRALGLLNSSVRALLQVRNPCHRNPKDVLGPYPRLLSQTWSSVVRSKGPPKCGQRRLRRHDRANP